MEQILTKIDQQQTRLKNLLFCYGAFQLLLRALLAVLVFFVLDYLIAPPRGMRIVMTLIVLGYLGYMAYWRLLYPLTRNFTPEDIALALEKKFPELDGALISGLQFHSLKEKDLNRMSKDLVRKAMEDAEKKSSGLVWKTLFQTARIKKLGLTCLLLFLLMSGYVIAYPNLAGVWALRALGGNAEWPRRTTLLIMLEGAGENFKLLSEPDPYSTQEVMVSRGATLPIRIKVEGSDPDEVFVIQDYETLGRMTSKASARRNNEYKYFFRNVREDMSFFVQGGDDDGHGREVSVKVVVPPAALNVSCDYTYPEYLNLEPETKESAQIEGPEGTLVDVGVTLSKEVKEAKLILRIGAEESALDLKKSDQAPQRLESRLKLEKSGTYRIELTGEEGFYNMDAPLHSIIVRKDQKPNVRLYSPRRTDLDLCQAGVVLFKAAAEDDYGVARMHLIYKPAGEPEMETRVFKDQELSAAYGAKRIVSGFAMDLDYTSFLFEQGQRKAEPGDTLIYAVQAADARPDQEAGLADSGQHMINIVSVNEKTRILTERQIRLKEEVKNIRNIQGERLAKTKAGLEEIQESLDPSQVLVSLEIGQNQLTSRYRSVTRELAYLFDDYLFNRLDKTSAAAAMLERAARIHLEAPVSEAFNVAPYQTLIDLHASGELGEMDLMERLIVMLGLSLDISQTKSPEAAACFSKGLTATDKSDYPQWIKKSVSQQEEILKALDNLLEKMAEWEDYQELIQLFRDVIDSQHNLNIITREELRKIK